MRGSKGQAAGTKFQVIPEAKVFGVSGSPRKNGNSDILLSNIMSGVSYEGVPACSRNLTKVQFQGCTGCEKCREDKVCTGIIDGMSILYDKIIAAKGIVLVSPTHNYNITSWMKAFIDRLYCFYNFEDDRPRSWSSQLAGQGRKAVIAGICEQVSEADMGFTMEAMRKPLKALGYDIIGELAVFGIFDKAGINGERDILEKAQGMGRELAKSLHV